MSAPDASHFDSGYAEQAQLSDGTAVTLRLVRPEDKALLRRGFERLSRESRYRRFLSSKHDLSDAELRYLTEVDGSSHFAIGATRRSPGGEEEGLGIARFIRVPGEPEVAEAAIAVADDFQGRGLGRLLLARLVAAARERGITTFRAASFADNAAVQALIHEAREGAVTGRADGTVCVEVALPDVLPRESSPPSSSALYQLFRAVARGVAAVLGSRHGSGPEPH